mmetsp:Transcript_7485/g.25321  ORF Transcript_7485/g.25321 Transcript_7485/m.25321 type:complete len:162 (-) Transcript_7485:55-540(-)
MGSSLSVTNRTEVPILVVLSQLTPLHWAVIPPGDTHEFSTGRVWYTVSADFHLPGARTPSTAEVAARCVGIAAGTIVFGGLGLIVTGALSGITSTQGTKMDGVYANGRTLTVSAAADDSGRVYRLSLDVPRSDEDRRDAVLEQELLSGDALEAHPTVAKPM